MTKKSILLLISSFLASCGGHLRELNEQQLFLTKNTAELAASVFDRQPEEYLSYNFIFVEEALNESVNDFCGANYGVWGCTHLEISTIIVGPDAYISPTRACFVLIHEFAHITNKLRGDDGDWDHNDPTVSAYYKPTTTKEFCRELARK